MRNLLVKLKRPETSLTCPFTGWAIQGKTEKKTPKAYSQRIADWIRHGALIVLENAGEAETSVQELIDTPHNSMAKSQLVEMAKEINSAEGDKVIEHENVNKADIVESIQAWKDEKENIGDGDEGDGEA